MKEFAKLLGPYARRLGNLVSRGAVSAVKSTTKMQTLQLRLMSDEQKDNVEHFEPFGFTSKPLAGAEHVTLFFDGDRSHGVTVVVADRRYRLTTLADGEVALHDAYGNKVHLKADGTLAIVAGLKVQITSPLTTTSGDLSVGGNLAVTGNITYGGTLTGPIATIGGKSMTTHTHSGVQTGVGNTGAPN